VNSGDDSENDTVRMERRGRIILKAVPGNPGKFYRLFRAPLNNLGTQCTSLAEPYI